MYVPLQVAGSWSHFFYTAFSPDGCLLVCVYIDPSALLPMHVRIVGPKSSVVALTAVSLYCDANTRLRPFLRLTSTMSQILLLLASNGGLTNSRLRRQRTYHTDENRSVNDRFVPYIALPA